MKTLATLAVLSLSTIAAVPAPDRSAVDEPFIRTGQVREWVVTSDGTVAFQLNGTVKPSADDEMFSLWIRTPASQTGTTELENLILDVLMANQHVDLPPALTVAIEPDESADGSSVSTALEFVWVGHGASLSAAAGSK